jgi:hypothetical protein
MRNLTTQEMDSVSGAGGSSGGSNGGGSDAFSVLSDILSNDLNNSLNCNKILDCNNIANVTGNTVVASVL